MGSDEVTRSRYEERTRQHYRDESKAADYAAHLHDSLPDRVLTTLEIRAVRRALAQLPGRPWRTIVDIPAGTGKLVPVLGPMADAYVGFDISAAMLSFVDDRAALAIADAEHVPVASGGADVVVCLRLLHRVPDDVFSGVVAEALRAARFGCVLSYAGTARSDRLHPLLRRVLRRPEFPRHTRDPAELARFVAGRGGRVVWDRSVSFGATAERVAAIVTMRAGDGR